MASDAAYSAGEKKFTAEGIASGVRIDGRPRLEYREVILETDVLPQCHGSARATIPDDGTDVMASVKVEIDKPDASAPDCGSLEVSASCWASMSASAATRAGDDFAASLTRTLQALLVDSNVIDKKGLCIMKRKYCWRVYVDVLVLDNGGNLVDTAVVAALAALADTKLPKVRLYEGETKEDWDLELDDDPFAFARLPGAAALPLAITFTQVGGHSVVDALLDEEACADSRVIVAVNRAGAVVSVQSEGPSGVTPPTLQACLQAAERIAPVLFGRIDRAIAASSAASAMAAASLGGDDDDGLAAASGAAAGGAGAGSTAAGRSKARHAAGTSLLSDRSAPVISEANAVDLDDGASVGAGAGAGAAVAGGR